MRTLHCYKEIMLKLNNSLHQKSLSRTRAISRKALHLKEMRM